MNDFLEKLKFVLKYLELKHNISHNYKITRVEIISNNHKMIFCIYGDDSFIYWNHIKYIENQEIKTPGLGLNHFHIEDFDKVFSLLNEFEFIKHATNNIINKVEFVKILHQNKSNFNREELQKHNLECYYYPLPPKIKNKKFFSKFKK